MLWVNSDISGTCQLSQPGIRCVWLHFPNQVKRHHLMLLLRSIAVDMGLQYKFLLIVVREMVQNVYYRARLKKVYSPVSRVS
jgi:hypothetical protein